LEKEKIEGIVELITGGTEELEEFRCAYKDIKKGIFNKLITGNKSLKKVGVLLQDSARKSDVATEIVESFLGAPELGVLEVGTQGNNPDNGAIEEITRICRQQKTRNVCVSIFGISYLR